MRHSDFLFFFNFAIVNHFIPKGIENAFNIFCFFLGIHFCLKVQLKEMGSFSDLQ